MIHAQDENPWQLTSASVETRQVFEDLSGFHVRLLLKSMTHCTEIRQRVVEYYQNLGFQLLPRAPMLHPSIPMSFVMNAGLVQVESS